VAETKVTRIKASDSSARSKKQPKRDKTPSTNPLLRALSGIGGYFKGAWLELRQVRWPTRKATWGLTLAVLIFSAFFVALILLLDLAFNSLFDLILT
jgi:preprotein translocase SecE subunit